MNATAPYYADPELYDAIYADMVADVPIHVGDAKSAGGPVLEVACGDGRVLIPMLEAGVDAEGLDLSDDMLAALRRRLAERRLAARLHRADMRDFALDRRFALVTIPFSAFLHNLTQNDQIATLTRCREHLLPGGRLHLSAFHPDPKLMAGFDGTSHLVKEIPNRLAPGTLRVIDRVTLDPVEQRQHVERRVEFVAPSGEVVGARELRFDLRYVYKPEMELLLRAAGFTRWEALPMPRIGESGPPPDRPIREGDSLLWHAWVD